MDKNRCPWCGKPIHTIATIDFAKVIAINNEIHERQNRLRKWSHDIMHQKQLQTEERANLYMREKALDEREELLVERELAFILLVNLAIPRKRKKKPLSYRVKDWVQRSKEQMNEFWHEMEQFWDMGY